MRLRSSPPCRQRKHSIFSMRLVSGACIGNVAEPARPPVSSSYSLLSCQKVSIVPGDCGSSPRINLWPSKTGTVSESIERSFTLSSILIFSTQCGKLLVPWPLNRVVHTSILSQVSFPCRLIFSLHNCEIGILPPSLCSGAMQYHIMSRGPWQ